MQPHGLFQIVGSYIPEMVTPNRCVGCCDSKGNCKDKKAFVAEATSTSTPFSIACNKPPPGVTIQLEPKYAANAVICTEVPVVGGDGQAANGSDPPSIPSGPSGHIGGGGGLPKEPFLPGFSGLFLLLFFLALGSTLWYRRQYQQALNANQSDKVANKPKAQ